MIKKSSTVAAFNLKKKLDTPCQCTVTCVFYCSLRLCDVAYLSVWHACTWVYSMCTLYLFNLWPFFTLMLLAATLFAVVSGKRLCFWVIPLTICAPSSIGSSSNGDAISWEDWLVSWRCFYTSDLNLEHNERSHSSPLHSACWSFVASLFCLAVLCARHRHEGVRMTPQKYLLESKWYSWDGIRVVPVYKETLACWDSGVRLLCMKLLLRGI